MLHHHLLLFYVCVSARAPARVFVWVGGLAHASSHARTHALRYLCHRKHMRIHMHPPEKTDAYARNMRMCMHLHVRKRTHARTCKIGRQTG